MVVRLMLQLILKNKQEEESDDWTEDERSETQATSDDLVNLILF